MPTLNGASQSPYVRKVRVALAEKGIEYEHNPILPFGLPPEYLEKHPLGKVPSYEDGDYVLPDSSCILAYLERTNPTPRLYPEDPREFGKALWYEEYTDTKLLEVTGPVFFERYVKKMMKQETDEERVQQHLTELIPPVFDYLEKQIEDREYLASAHFSIADLSVGSPFVNLLHAGEKVDASRWPKLAAYVERIHSRPSYKQCIEEEMA